MGMDRRYLAAEMEAAEHPEKVTHRKRIRPLVDETPAGLVTPEEVEALVEADRAAMFRIRVLLGALPCTASVARTWADTGVPTVAELADYLERVVQVQAAAMAGYEADRTELMRLKALLAGAAELAAHIERLADELTCRNLDPAAAEPTGVTHETPAAR